MYDRTKVANKRLITKLNLRIFFQNATKSLNIIENPYLKNNANEILNPVDKAVFKYKNHPSILTIKNSLGATTPFLLKKFLCLILSRN